MCTNLSRNELNLKINDLESKNAELLQQINDKDMQIFEFTNKINDLEFRNLELNGKVTELENSNGAQLASKDIDEQIQDLSKALKNIKNDETEFLTAIKERILVLFAGLNAFDKGAVEARVELSLKFMEFLLASFDNRLEDISK